MMDRAIEAAAAAGLLGSSTKNEPVDLPTPLPKPPGLREVTIETEEVTSFCPVTNQPDFWSISITYYPTESILETKSLKLYLRKFREERKFIEALASQIAHELSGVLECVVTIEIRAKSRGGLELLATAEASGQNPSTFELEFSKFVLPQESKETPDV